MKLIFKSLLFFSCLSYLYLAWERYGRQLFFSNSNDELLWLPFFVSIAAPLVILNFYNLFFGSNVALKVDSWKDFSSILKNYLLQINSLFISTIHILIWCLIFIILSFYLYNLPNGKIVSKVISEPQAFKVENKVVEEKITKKIPLFNEVNKVEERNIINKFLPFTKDYIQTLDDKSIFQDFRYIAKEKNYIVPASGYFRHNQTEVLLNSYGTSEGSIFEDQLPKFYINLPAIEIQITNNRNTVMELSSYTAIINEYAEFPNPVFTFSNEIQYDRSCQNIMAYEQCPYNYLHIPIYNYSEFIPKQIDFKYAIINSSELNSQNLNQFVGDKYPIIKKSIDTKEVKLKLNSMTFNEDIDYDIALPLNDLPLSNLEKSVVIYGSMCYNNLQNQRICQKFTLKAHLAPWFYGGAGGYNNHQSLYPLYRYDEYSDYYPLTLKLDQEKENINRFYEGKSIKIPPGEKKRLIFYVYANKSAMLKFQIKLITNHGEISSDSYLIEYFYPRNYELYKPPQEDKLGHKLEINTENDIQNLYRIKHLRYNINSFKITLSDLYDDNLLLSKTPLLDDLPAKVNKRKLKRMINDIGENFGIEKPKVKDFKRIRSLLKEYGSSNPLNKLSESLETQYLKAIFLYNYWSFPQPTLIIEPYGEWSSMNKYQKNLLLKDIINKKSEILFANNKVEMLKTCLNNSQECKIDLNRTWITEIRWVVPKEIIYRIDKIISTHYYRKYKKIKIPYIVKDFQGVSFEEGTVDYRISF
ncbi:MAG: hypothetical protein HRT47_12160 [Candidatus Caenarcaniphilales bacterium]|nr:hypothetical protein [Candidatus Caenarcaniphilales bacterium]